MSDDRMMQKAENYWVSYREYESVYYSVPGTSVWGYGRAAVRFDSPLAQKGWIYVTFGGPDEHSSGGPCPSLSMPVDVAVALISQLRAAVTDAFISEGEDLEQVPYEDVTVRPCECDYCTYYREQRS